MIQRSPTKIMKLIHISFTSFGVKITFNFAKKNFVLFNEAWSWWTLNDKGFRAFLRGGATRYKLQSFRCKHSFSIRDAAVYRTLECGSLNKRWLTMTNISGHVTSVTFSRVNHLSTFRGWSNKVHLVWKNSWFISFYWDIRCKLMSSQLIFNQEKYHQSRELS